MANDWGPRTIVSESAAMQRPFRELEQVAPTQSTVLLLGETGVGKEVFAQAIHDRSPRAGRPMTSVNCAAIPAGILDSELFGRERGAYTDAHTRQVGRFEAALRFLENAHSVAPVSRSVDNDKPAEETRTLNMNALQKRADQELERRKSHVLSAMAVRGEQQGGKSGSKRIQSHVGSATRRQQARRDTNNK